jgi:L-rhamnose mutarotase
VETIGFAMQLKPGRAAEYERRHDNLWPELAGLLKDSGVRDYSIFLEEETGRLFAVLTRPAEHNNEALSEAEIMRK